MSDPNYAHKFWANRKGRCQLVVSGKHCGLLENDLIHTRWKEKEKVETLPCGCPCPQEIELFSQCSLHKPLMMVIPLDGVHLSCTVHPEGHHIYGQQVRY